MKDLTRAQLQQFRGTLVRVPADHPSNHARRPVVGRIWDVTDGAVAVSPLAAQDVSFLDEWVNANRVEILVEAQ